MISCSEIYKKKKTVYITSVNILFFYHNMWLVKYALDLLFSTIANLLFTNFTTNLTVYVLDALVSILFAKWSTNWISTRALIILMPYTVNDLWRCILGFICWYRLPPVSRIPLRAVFPINTPLNDTSLLSWYLLSRCLTVNNLLHKKLSTPCGLLLLQDLIVACF